jgi:hypothetical protein
MSCPFIPIINAWQRSGWQRQAQLGDGGRAESLTIAKAFGLDAATRKKARPIPAHQ